MTKKSKFSFIKNWFTYTQSERSATYALLFLAIIFATIPFVFDAFFRPPAKLAYQEIYVNQLENQQVKYLQSTNKGDAKYEKNTAAFKITDLNNATWKDFVTVGIDSKTANSILNYRKAIKVYKNWSQVEKVYGLDSIKLNILKKYFILEETSTSQTLTTNNYVSKTAQEATKKPIELNDADSATFTKVYGIGAYYAGKITKRRKELGGFYQIEQLKEIYGITDTIFLKIAPQITCNGSVNKININIANASELASHPYIKWPAANRIVKYIQFHQKINNFEEFQKASLLGDSLVKKLKPYLVFE